MCERVAQGICVRERVRERVRGCVVSVSEKVRERVRVCEREGERLRGCVCVSE